MVCVKFGIIVVLGVVMVPYWDFNNISAFPELFSFLRDVLLTLPFTLFSILFVQILSPMNIAYRKVESDKRIATYRAIRANRVAYIIWLLQCCSLPSLLLSRLAMSRLSRRLNKISLPWRLPLRLFPVRLSVS